MASGVYIEIIPGKLLCGRKAPCGRRKARIVGCGNFGTPDEAVTTSTGGIDAVALRALMNCDGGWVSYPVEFCTATITGSTAEAELVATLLEALGMEGVRRSLYGDNKSALALCQGDVGAWRTRHLRLRAAGLRAAVGCEVSGWHTHHVKGAELPPDGFTKQLMGPAFELFVNQIAMKKARCYHLTQL